MQRPALPPPPQNRRRRSRPRPTHHPPPSPAAAACSFLAELEMKLHLSAEDVGLYLQDHSARAQQRIPAAAKELLHIKVRQAGAGSRWPGGRLCCAMLASQLLEQTGCHSCSFAAHLCLTPLPQDDVASLRASAAAALRTLEDAGSGQAAAVVGQLAELDLVKRRMEDACSTLKVRAGGSGGSACQLLPLLLMSDMLETLARQHPLVCCLPPTHTPCCCLPPCPAAGGSGPVCPVPAGGRALCLWQPAARGRRAGGHAARAGGGGRLGGRVPWRVGGACLLSRGCTADSLCLTICSALPVVLLVVCGW
jgi:hypothetical protein